MANTTNNTLSLCSKHYQKELKFYAQRIRNYDNLKFTDEEALTIYLFGVMDNHKEIKTIYDYADRHLRDWFPHLPNYAAYNYRLNQLSGVFAPLLQIILGSKELENGKAVWLIDSFPVRLAKQGHRFRAKVAPDLAKHGYCSTKKLYYYGVKVHVVGKRQKGSLPFPEYIGVTGANEHDGLVFEQIRPMLCNNELYGDKAYKRPDFKEIEDKQQLTVYTPVKKKKGQEYLDVADQWFSTAISKVRQPIESLFAWIEEKTGIETAKKVRSTNGLLVHIFGKLAAAMFFWIYFRSNF